MAKKITTAEFIARAKEVHGDRYDYSKVIYKDSKTKICIICPEHGEFYQEPTSHLSGCGCKECAKIKRKNTKTSKRLSYIEAKTKIKDFEINSQNDYLSIYETDLRPLNFPKCPKSAYKNEGWISWAIFLGKERGKGIEFLPYQEANEYVKTLGIKSPKEWRDACKNGKIPSTIPFYPEKTYLNKGWNGYEEWLGDTYQSRYRECYSYEEAKTILKKYNIQSTTDFFELKRNGTLPHQIPSQPQHYYKEKWIDWPDFLGVKNFAFRDKYGFISMSNQVHKNRYDYSKVEYVNTNTEVTIICPEHGEFKQTPYLHSRGHGCPNCQGLRKEYKFNLLNEFVDEFRLRDFLMTNDENLIYIILRNIEKIDPKFNPIVKDIDRVLRSDSTNPIEVLEDKYRTSDETVTSDTVVGEINTKSIDDIDLDDDDAVEAFINNTNITVEKTEPTIDELTRARENEINLINTIEHMLTPEDRQFIKDKFLNDKRRNWMLERDRNV